jgi:hypothetical protein
LPDRSGYHGLAPNGRWLFRDRILAVYIAIVPIILALFPTLAGVPNVECIFDVVLLVIACRGRRARPATVEVAAATALRRAIDTRRLTMLVVRTILC